jgi:hypothetical protein
VAYTIRLTQDDRELFENILMELRVLSTLLIRRDALYDLDIPVPPRADVEVPL